MENQNETMNAYREKFKRTKNYNPGETYKAFREKLECLEDVDEIRGEILRFSMPEITYTTIQMESTYTDNFGDTEELDVPELKINGEERHPWPYRMTMEFALKNLDPTPEERRKIEENLELISIWEGFYGRLI
jgi:hypothetical protein